MCKNPRKSLSLLTLFLLCVAPLLATQAPEETSPTEALRTRVLLYYGTLQKGEKAAAVNLVAPESKNDFARMNYAGLTAFRVLQVNLSDAGDTGTVQVLRTDAFPGFPQLLDHETVDTWKRIDGQWYVVLPALKERGELDTPFGRIKFAAQGDNQLQALPPVLLPGAQNTVSPEEAKKALQKALLEPSKQKPGDQEKQPEEKKPKDQTPPKQNPQN